MFSSHHFNSSRDCAFSVDLLWYNFFLPLRYVVLGETETVIEQASLLELLMTKELLDLSALTRNLQKKDYSALGYYCFIHNQVLSLFL